MTAEQLAALEGSSPRMRGALFLAPREDNRTRIIPAYAGSTDHTYPLYPYCRDHPRVCGEHVLLAVKSGDVTGSSPRMRGAHGTAIDGGYATGIIPAYAGSTIRMMASHSSAEDHPRVCGEHYIPESKGRPRVGSSPRMRGALMTCYGRWPSRRIIPAYAGSTADDH